MNKFKNTSLKYIQWILNIQYYTNGFNEFKYSNLILSTIYNLKNNSNKLIIKFFSNINRVIIKLMNKFKNTSHKYLQWIYNNIQLDLKNLNIQINDS